MRCLLLMFSLLLIGCLQEAGSPDFVEPNVKSEVRVKISKSLQGADRADCLTVYGIYSAAARYVESEQLEAANTAELRQQILKVCELRDWPTGKYPAFSTAFTEVADPLLSDNKTVIDRRMEIATLFRQIGLGAKDAAQ